MTVNTSKGKKKERHPERDAIPYTCYRNYSVYGYLVLLGSRTCQLSQNQMHRVQIKGNQDEVTGVVQNILRYDFTQNYVTYLT